MHAFDALTPVEETLSALYALVTAGKVRYIGCSNFSGWHLMKSLAASDRHGLPGTSPTGVLPLVGRDYEWELMPLGLDQGSVRWSPLGWGRLTGKMRRGQPLPATTRLTSRVSQEKAATDEYVYRVVDVSTEVAAETARSAAGGPQLAARAAHGRDRHHRALGRGTACGEPGGGRWSLTRTRWPGWTRPARSPSRTRTGTSGGDCTATSSRRTCCSTPTTPYVTDFGPPSGSMRTPA